MLFIDSVWVCKKYYPQIFLEECKYIIQKNKVENLINDHLDSSSSADPDSEFGSGFDSGSKDQFVED